MTLSNSHRRRSAHQMPGFTLIELLITVAIIAILAAIAVPNFLTAQTRSKVSRVKADFATLATALETYHTDNGRYPEDYAATTPRYTGMGRLTTPITYITSVPLDPFGGYFSNSHNVQVHSYTLGTAPDDHPVRWALASAGPDRNDDTVPLFDYPGYSPNIWENPASGYSYYRYDPTNGTISKGDIIRASDRVEP